MTEVIAEIGINHNGSIELCKDLINLSKISGIKYVKIQKRNPDICVPEHQKNIEKDTPGVPTKKQRQENSLLYLT